MSLSLFLVYLDLMANPNQLVGREREGDVVDMASGGQRDDADESQREHWMQISNVTRIDSPNWQPLLSIWTLHLAEMSHLTRRQGSRSSQLD